MSYELKACPFCEGKLIRDGLGQYWLHELKTMCIFRGLMTTPRDLQRWNSRPIESSLKSRLKIAVEALEIIKHTTQYDWVHAASTAKEALAKIRS